MPSPAELARDEAYASAPVDQIVWHVVELDTPAFGAPLFFIAAAETDTAITLETGAVVIAIACAFDLTPPSFDDTGPGSAKLRIDGVSVRLFPLLRQAAPGGAIKVTYRAYLGTDFTAVVDVIAGLELRKVTLSAASAEGDLTFPEIATQAFPRRTYDLEQYPGLWNA